MPSVAYVTSLAWPRNGNRERRGGGWSQTLKTLWPQAGETRDTDEHEAAAGLQLLGCDAVVRNVDFCGGT